MLARSPVPLPKDLPPRGRGTARRRWKEFPPAVSIAPGSPVGQGLRPCRRLHIGALRSPLSPFAPPEETCSSPVTPPQRPPSSREGDHPQAVEGVPSRYLHCTGFTRRSKPSVLPPITYRGFAIAPITLRASFRSPLYNPGCRVATLLVSKGVMGFLGDLREDRSRARPVGGSARRSIPSEREQPCCDL